MYLHWLKKYNLLIFDSIDSTNSEAIRLAKANVAGDFVIWAASQTNGRGRHGRTWQAGDNNFYVSLLLDRNIQIQQMPQLSFVVGIAVYETIAYVAKACNLQLAMGLKWPNDLLINSKKVSGILIESITVSGKIYCVIGVGVNVDSTPLCVDKIAISLRESGIVNVHSDYILNLFINAFEKYFAIWKKYGFDSIKKRWIKRAQYLNQIVTLNDGVNRVLGEFIDMDHNGNICVRLASGQLYTASNAYVDTEQHSCHHIMI